MSEMIERAARAIAKAAWMRIATDVPSSDGYADAEWREYVGDARAVIEAMQEPVGRAIDAAMIEWFDRHYDSPHRVCYGPLPGTAMRDHILAAIGALK